MASVKGIGGVFFKSPDPKRLSAWYAEHLGMKVEAWGGVILRPADLPPGACTVWSPFEASTEYFQPSKAAFQINLIVDDVDEALKQVAAGGAQVVGTPADESNGRFGWFLDPDGNKVELWKPAPPSTTA